MSWKQKFTDSMADVCRFMVRAAVYADVILFAAFSVWFAAKFCWFSACALNRVLFSKPW